MEPLEGRRLFAYSPAYVASVPLGNANSGNDGGVNGNVALDAAGDLFGTIQSGGALGLGSIAKVPAGSSTGTTVATFDGLNGEAPGNIVVDAAGDVFGVCAMSTTTALTSLDPTYTYGNGVLWELPAGSSTIVPQVTFTATGPRYPTDVVFDSSGNLLVMCSQGGANNTGAIVSVNPTTFAATTLAPLPASYNTVLASSISTDAAGNIYGTTINSDGDYPNDPI